MYRLKNFSHSFRFRILLSAIVVLIPAILLPTALTARINIQNQMARDEQQAAVTFEIAQANLESFVSNLSGVNHVIQLNQEIDHYLLMKNENDLSRVIAKQQFDQALSTIFYMYDYVTDILFIKEDGTIVGSSLDWHYALERNDHPLVSLPAFRHAQKSHLPAWIGPLPASFFAQSDTRSGYRLCRVSQLSYTYSGSAINHNITVLISVDEKAIHERFSYLADGVSEIMLLDGEGNCLSSSDPALLNTQAPFYADIPSQPFGSFTYGKNDSVQVIYSRMASPGWTLVRIIPTQFYNISSNGLMKNALIIALITLSIICVLYSIWLHRLCDPLEEMTHTLINVRNGNWDVRLSPSRHAPIEIKLMTEQMNQMLDSLQDLIQRNMQNEQRKYQLEMRALQAQITPHFLFNTLGAIRWKAASCGAGEVVQMLISFMQLLRPVFSDWTMEWSLREELHFAQNYIDLTRMRCDGKADIHIQCDESLLDQTVPRFTLQPILENSCEHGMRSGHPLQVGVTISRQENGLRIRVRDNGVGMQREQLDRLRRNLQEEDLPVPGKDGHRSIGLFNIQKRLTLYYGSESGLQIESRPGEGTQVDIYIGYHTSV